MQPATTTNTVTQKQAVEAAVSRYGRERLVNVYMKTQKYIDEVFEAFKKWRWLSYWREAHLAGAKNIFDVIAIKMTEYAMEDPKLKDALMKPEKDASYFMFYGAHQSTINLCKKVASLLFAGLGLPPEDGHCRYDVNAKTEFHRTIPEYFDMIKIFIDLPKTVKEGDQFGDCVVTHVFRQSRNTIKNVRFHNPKTGYYFTMKRFVDKSDKKRGKKSNDEKVTLTFCESTLNVYRNLYVHYMDHVWCVERK